MIVLARGGGEPSARRGRRSSTTRWRATWRLGTLVDTDSRNEGTSLGKQVEASYTRLFQAARERPGARPRRAAATEAGWTVGETTERGFLAERRVASGRLELAVTLIEDAQLLPDDLAAGALRQSPALGRPNGPRSVSPSLVEPPDALEPSSRECGVDVVVGDQLRAERVCPALAASPGTPSPPR